MKTLDRTVPTAADYERIFEAERLEGYPEVDAFEHRMGFALDRTLLESWARVLACPLKQHAPNWQHGRVLYAVARAYVTRSQARWRPFTFLDIGTAKGFSALCLQEALGDTLGCVVSVDVIDPHARVKRNTVAEMDGFKTLYETLAPFPEATTISFQQSTGQKWLQEHPEDVHVAFIDGKHSYDAVSWETALLAERQRAGDVAMFDDVQIEGVAKALKQSKAYEFEYIDVQPERKYAIGRRK